MANPNYVVLLKGNMWRPPGGSIHLTTFKEKDYYARMSDVSEDDMPHVEEAIEMGLLAKSKAPHKTREKALNDAQKKAHEPIVTGVNKNKLIWDSMEKVKAEGEKANLPAKSPSLTRRSAKYSDPNSKAFKILQQGSLEDIRKDLTAMVGKLKDTKAKVEFLKDAEHQEINGYNPTSQCRNGVIDHIQDLLAEFDTRKIAISNVVTVIEE